MTLTPPALGSAQRGALGQHRQPAGASLCVRQRRAVSGWGSQMGMAEPCAPPGSVAEGHLVAGVLRSWTCGMWEPLVSGLMSLVPLPCREAHSGHCATLPSPSDPLGGCLQDTRGRVPGSSPLVL